MPRRAICCFIATRRSLRSDLTPAVATLSGDPVRVAGDVAFNPANGRGSFDVSQNGAFVYFQGTGGPTGRGNVNNNSVFGWRDRTGNILAQAGDQGPYGDIDLSPDGTRVAVTRQDIGAASADIWVTDWERNVTQKLTLDAADDINPVWSQDNKWIAFTSFRNGNADVFVHRSNGDGQDIPILNSPRDESVEDWSKDGRSIVYKLGQDGYDDLYVLPLDADLKPGKPLPVVQGKFQKDEAQFSYDGKWLAYISDESGTFQVYVMTFPGTDGETPGLVARRRRPAALAEGREGTLLSHLRRPGDGGKHDAGRDGRLRHSASVVRHRREPDVARPSAPHVVGVARRRAIPRSFGERQRRDGRQPGRRAHGASQLQRDHVSWRDRRGDDKSAAERPDGRPRLAGRVHEGGEMKTVVGRGFSPADDAGPEGPACIRPEVSDGPR